MGLLHHRRTATVTATATLAAALALAAAVAPASARPRPAPVSLGTGLTGLRLAHRPASDTAHADRGRRPRRGSRRRHRSGLRPLERRDRNGRSRHRPPHERPGPAPRRQRHQDVHRDGRPPAGRRAPRRSRRARGPLSARADREQRLRRPEDHRAPPRHGRRPRGPRRAPHLLPRLLVRHVPRRGLRDGVPRPHRPHGPRRRDRPGPLQPPAPRRHRGRQRAGAAPLGRLGRRTGRRVRARRDPGSGPGHRRPRPAHGCRAAPGDRRRFVADVPTRRAHRAVHRLQRPVGRHGRGATVVRVRRPHPAPGRSGAARRTGRRLRERPGLPARRRRRRVRLRQRADRDPLR